jgi:hypothetical protein
MATLEGANPELRSAVERMIAESDGKLTLNSGFRSNEEQTALWEASDKSGTWVAEPGHSNHEKGSAADIGGDMDYLAANAARYGLYMPMSWENWHVELAGQEGGGYNADAHGTAPAGYVEKPRDHMATLMAMMGGVDRAGSQPSFARQITGSRPKRTDPMVQGAVQARMPGAPIVAGDEDTILDAFRVALRSKESDGNYGALGVMTPWGRASGAYQYLDGTWAGYKGYARAADAPAAIQDEKARLDMQALYDQFGSWDLVAAAWFAGPNGNFSTAEVRAYMADVINRMGGK